MTLYICGFMGCGKTSVGKQLAKDLDYYFVDLDEYISEKEKLSIAEIFKSKGEQYFRSLESKALHSLNVNNTVIATGGGALTSKQNIHFATQTGSIIFIDTSFKHCFERIKGDPSRPVATTKSKDQLFALYKKRLPFYIAAANVQVDGNNNVKTISQEIIKNLNL